MILTNKKIQMIRVAQTECRSGRLSGTSFDWAERMIRQPSESGSQLAKRSETRPGNYCKNQMGSYMRTYRLNFRNGEVGELRQLDDGSWACPICGEPWHRFPPYWPNDGELGSVHSVSTPELGAICPGCDVEFGVDEGCAPYAQIGWMHRQYRELRVRWLDRVGWSAEALKQLQENLGISEAQARHEAVEVRRGDS